MKNLLIAIGNSNLSENITFDPQLYDVIHLPSSNAIIESTSVFFNNPFLRDIVVLNKSSILKADREIENGYLYNLITFIHLDYLLLNQKSNLEVDINFRSVPIYNNILYTPRYTVFPFHYKDLIIPSPTFWVCSSNTFNIVSNINTKALLKTDTKWDIGLSKTVINKGIFKHNELQFWNYLGSMNIDIKTI